MTDIQLTQYESDVLKYTYTAMKGDDSIDILLSKISPENKLLIGSNTEDTDQFNGIKTKTDDEFIITLNNFLKKKYITKKDINDVLDEKKYGYTLTNISDIKKIPGYRADVLYYDKLTDKIVVAFDNTKYLEKYYPILRKIFLEQYLARAKYFSGNGDGDDFIVMYNAPDITTGPLSTFSKKELWTDNLNIDLFRLVYIPEYEYIKLMTSKI